MKVLLIGGAGFIGSHVVSELLRGGHEVTVLHRRLKKLPDGVRQISGDRNDLKSHSAELIEAAPEVVIDLILSNGAQARELMTAVRGIAARVVALSSGDVYRAAGVLHGFESGALQPMPLTEESELRTRTNVYGPAILERLRSVFTWLGDDYDKIPVEQTVLGAPEPPGTVLRLPMVYGPCDPLHRLHPYLKRMDDGRTFILLGQESARWRGPRGYVENVAAAIASAATSKTASGRIYNVAEMHACTEREWVERIARGVGWKGEIVELPLDRIPDHLRTPGNLQQHWIMNSARIRQELGFAEPVSEETALRRTIAWERAHPPSIDAAQFNYPAEDAACGRNR